MGHSAPAGNAVAYPAAVAHVPKVAVLVLALMAFTACTSKTGGNQASSVTASNVRLTAAQREHVQLYTVQPSRFHRTVVTTGLVDFDNDQATSVLAPFSGPVSQLLVSLGAQVQAGTALAAVDSPDFATAIGAYRKALTTAQTSRRLADLDKDLLEHDGVSQREAAQAETDAISAEADRDAALQELVSLKVAPQTIKAIQEGRNIPRPEAMIRSPSQEPWSRNSSLPDNFWRPAPRRASRLPTFPVSGYWRSSSARTLRRSTPAIPLRW